MARFSARKREDLRIDELGNRIANAIKRETELAVDPASLCIIG